MGGGGVREGITQKSQVAELASEGKGETGRERKEREEEKGQERKRVSESQGMKESMLFWKGNKKSKGKNSHNLIRGKISVNNSPSYVRISVPEH